MGALRAPDSNTEYVLSDVVLCSRAGEYGPADLGEKGIENFLANHRCNQFCSKNWKTWSGAQCHFEPLMSTTLQTVPRPGHRASLGGSHVCLFPTEIRFTQDSIKNKFQDGRSLAQTAIQVGNHEIQKRHIPMIGVVERNGSYWSLDNRRLAVFRLLQMCGKINRIKVDVIPFSRVADEWRAKYDGGDGKTIRVRGINCVVGDAEYNTTFPLENIRMATRARNHESANLTDQQFTLFLGTLLDE